MVVFTEVVKLVIVLALADEVLVEPAALMVELEITAVAFGVDVKYEV